ncbi:MAG: imidazoleglycerol-phosphate dehydratase HisB [Oscillospiraceae bacterium]
MTERKSEINRNTAETQISLRLNLDGHGEYDIDTGCGFLDHMLTLFAVHSRFDLTVHCNGDTNVDDHHTVEDIGICLGSAFSLALSDKAGITRYNSTVVPMDEALVLAAVDLSGRGYLNYNLNFPTEKIGTFDSELIEEFFVAFTRSAQVTLHLKQMDGKNSHHIAEAAFKASARAFRDAVRIDEALGGAIPSSKGSL